MGMSQDVVLQIPSEKVFEHCGQVRSACQGQGHSVLRRSQGQAPLALVGAVQITVDVAGAFDAILRHHLLNFRGHETHWSANQVYGYDYAMASKAQNAVSHDDIDRHIAATQSDRQACAIAPTL